MPEGHLIHHLERVHTERLAGRALAASSPQGRFAAGAAEIDGRRLDAVEAYGKHLFHRFGEIVLHCHLGRLGAFPWLEAPIPEPRAQVRLRLAASTGAADLIAPIACEVGSPALRDDVVSRLGPDPLRDDANASAVGRALASDGRAIGTVLLDQSVMSGVGNVLRSEVLFLVGVHPRAPASAVAFERLWTTLAAVMERSRDLGRIVTVADDDAPEREARFVYKQDACRRCGAPVERLAVGGRLMYRCPVEQAALAPG